MTHNNPQQPDQNPDLSTDSDPVVSESHIIADRRAKLERLRTEFQIDPYGNRTDGIVAIDTARNLYDPAADQAAKDDPANDSRPVVKAAGRVVLHRDIGKLVFITLRDDTGDIQLAVSKKNIPAAPFKLAKITDLGDIVVAQGPLAKTKTGEITIWATGDEGYTLATKSLAPPPGKHSGLKDAELRYRKRYVDLYTNPEVLATFATRSRIVKTIRDFLTDPPQDLAPGYLEVETPMMQSIAGGAAARPFTTHHNALDLDLFLRIAPELYLKRLLVGGMKRVFEINRNFRNEGIDRSHNPEFTMLELYQAFGNLESVMHLTERLINHAAQTVCGSEKLPYGDTEISYKLPFARITYHDSFEQANGFPASDTEKLNAKAKQLGIETAGKDHAVLLNDVWEETVEPTLIQPTFIIDYPAPLCPLTKAKPGNPDIAERFELFISNMELANAYTELNDPDVQLQNFEQQVAGLDDEEATFRTMDHDFIEALRVGMPPAGGLGIGIDRLVMLLTNQRSIRDVILFPLMRPQA